MIALEARALRKVYHRGSEQVAAIDGVSVTVAGGEFVSFVGPSGSGKTTLLNLLGCLDNPTSGELSLAGRPIFAAGRNLSERELTLARREIFGYIFQSFYLIPTLTVRENVVLPLTFYRKAADERHVPALLDLLGLGPRADHLPGQLSGGEMQRAAIARALVNRPEILLADEPTGNLDTARTSEIGRVLHDLNRNAGITVVMVTHNLGLARQADRVIEMRDGRIHGETAGEAAAREGSPTQGGLP